MVGVVSDDICGALALVAEIFLEVMTMQETGSICTVTMLFFEHGKWCQPLELTPR